MTAVGELELPAFDYLDPTLKGPRFHDDDARSWPAQGWLASMPLGFVVLEREAGEFFLRSRSFTFPGMKIAEIFGIDDGPLWEEIRRNILHINGEDHRRLRGLVNPFFTPRAVERWRPTMRATLEELFDDSGRADVRRLALQAVSEPRDRDGDGRAARGRRAAVGLVELDPAPVRDEGARGAPADRAGRHRVLRLGR